MSWNGHVLVKTPTTPPVPHPGMGPDGTPGLLLKDLTSDTKKGPSEVRLLVAICRSYQAYCLPIVRVGVLLTSLQPSRATLWIPGLLTDVDL